ncbi:MAG: type 1 glutamine amidotransferase [Candidatus Scalindua sp.]|nr:type 1 glutamine amidotransferase [Candidatus Scalindua sp.]
MVLIIKHIDIEGPGTIGEFLDEKGVPCRTIDLSEGEPLPESLGGVSAVIVLGGPMNVYEEERYPFLRKEDLFLRGVFEKGLPVLGFCLGAQLIAKAKGTTVKKNPVKEIGWFTVSLDKDALPDPLFQGFPEEFDVFQWHGDTFEIPDNATKLAGSALCSNQAFRVDGNVYGLQFHIEVTDDMVQQWINAYKDEIDSLKGSVDPEKIVSDTKVKFDNYRKHARLFGSNFLELINTN